MALSSQVKRGLIAFLLFDAAVIVVLITLFNLKSGIDIKDQLREIGVTVFTDIRPIQEFELVDENLKPYTSALLNGKWTMLFFGFTSCPDICPITMAELKKFYEQLDDPSLKDDLNVVMVSVDPERDDPETMGNYVNGFNDEFLGVTGDFDSIAEVAAQFFVGYSEPVYEGLNPEENQESHQHGQQQVELQQEPHHNAEQQEEGHDTSTPTSDNYLISHSGHIALVDPAGNYHAVMRPPHRARDLITAYTMIRANSRL